MEPSDNPYHVLGISETATPREIRAAYRRAALEHHPDRAGPGAKETFSKISHAYEVLTDEDQAQAFLSRQEQAQQGGGGSGGRGSWQQQDDHPMYHDPFAVFESVFRDEFGRDFFRGGHPHRGGMMDSPFFRDPFQSDPFFSSSPFHRGGASPFGGGRSMFQDSFFGGGADPFAQAAQSMFSQAAHGNGGEGTHHHHQFYSSSTVSRRDSNGNWVTETHRNHNGQTAREKVKRSQDGSILERSVEGNEELLGNNNDSRPVAALESDKKKSNEGLFRLPWGQRRRGGGEEKEGDE